VKAQTFLALSFHSTDHPHHPVQLI